MKKSVIILIIMLALFCALVSAIDLKIPKCSDYCANSAYYHDGYFSVRSGGCEYETTGCRYGCAGDKCATAIDIPEDTMPDTPTEPLTVRDKCPDFCENSVFNYGGSYRGFTGDCDYQYSAKCASGCDILGLGCASSREETDKDNDGTPDSRDPCPNDFTNDRDDDGTCEDIDNCPGLPNKDQLDSDNDGEGDLCDCNDTIKSANEEGVDCGGQCPACDLCTVKVLPSKFDWRNRDGKNWMTPVKNQASCGSCWAFGTIGATEARFNIENNKPFNLDLSEQNLVSDCGHPGGCLGGSAPDAMKFIQSQGVVTEACYPYKSQKCIYKNTRQKGGPKYLCEELCKHENACSYPGSCYLCEDFQNQLWYIKTYSPVPNDIPTIKRALVCKGPLVVASDNWWHVIVLVGWDDSKSSWIIKNSWGSGWSNKGYGMIPYEGHKYSDLKEEVFWVWGVYSPTYTKMKEYISAQGLDKP